MLFILVMEVINHTIRWLDQQGLLAPFVNARLPQRASIYADDLILFVAPRNSDLSALRTVLQVFGQASGLFANLDKSVATPIHCTDAEIQLVQEALSCRIEGFPCRYLGVPLSIFRLRKIEEQALIDAVTAHIPRWKGSLLNVAGRTPLVQVTLSAIPVYMVIASCLSSWAIDCIDKLRRGVHLG
jgi:hypothetical protein